MTTYQRRGGQYQTRSGATAYRRGVRGAKAKPVLSGREKVLLVAAGTAMAWHAAPILVVLAGVGALVYLAAPHVSRWAANARKAHRAYRKHKATAAAFMDAKAGRFDSRRQQPTRPPVDLLAAWRQRRAQPARRAAADHPYTAGRPPLFLCGTCNEPHRKAAA